MAWQADLFGKALAAEGCQTGQVAVDPVAVLATELARARQRGLAKLDLPLRDHPPPDLVQLEALARRYTGDDSGRRVELIRRLLHDALPAYSAAGYELEADLIRRLFFGDGTGERLSRQSAGDLLRPVVADSGLDRASFDEHRVAVFRDFAAFLITFVEPPSPAEVPDREPVAGRRRIALPIGVLGVAVAVALVGWLVWLDHPSRTGHQAASPPPTSGASPAPTASGSTGVNSPTLTFDDLGGGSTIITVFPGVKNTPADERQDGTYRSGDKVTALCKAAGRTVISDPQVGEQRRQSSEWVQIKGSPGVQQYASLTYGDMSPRQLGELPSCVGPP